MFVVFKINNAVAQIRKLTEEKR